MSGIKSTTVRIPSSGHAPDATRAPRTGSGLPGPIDQALRGAFAAGERVAPPLAGRLAGSLFTRVPPIPSSDKRRRDYPTGELSTLAVGSQQRRVVVERFGSGGPVVLLVHGWGGWRHQLYAHLEPLLDHGFSVVAHDALSHGDSDAGALGAGRTVMPELAEALVAVAAATGPLHAVIAHSGGAMATVWSLARGDAPLAADRLALIAPTVHTHDMLTWFGARFGIGSRGLADMVTRLERRFDLQLSDLDALVSVDTLRGLDARSDAIRDGRLPALLTVHDRDDADTPWQGSVDLADAWPGSELLLTEGLGHRRVLWDADVVDHVVRFVAD